MKAIEKLKEEDKRKALACRWHNEVKSLNFEVGEEDIVEPMDITVKDGRRVYQRGILFVMTKAFYELYPDLIIKVEFQLQNSLYCTIDNCKVTDEIIQNVKKKMQEIIDKDLEIKKIEMSREEAEKFYDKEKTLRGILQLDNQYKDEISLYFCEDYYNYFYGVMPISTGYVKNFDIMKYYDGFLVRYPGKQNPEEVQEYKETKKLLQALKDYNDIHEILNIDTVYKLNKKIREGKEKEIILLAEALHEKKISDIADEIVKRKGIKMVLIAGPSSSGKTTFAQRLGIQLRLNGLKPVTISVDNYFVERQDTPRDENGEYNFECIEAIDLKLFNEHLVKLLNGEEIEVPEFDFAVGTKRYNGKKMKLADDEILVIEGIHCLNDKLTSQIPMDQKYKIYISALTVLNMDRYNRISTTDTRLIRRIVRDYQFRSYSALHTLNTWHKVTEGEEKNIFPFQESANTIFNTSLIYELNALKPIAMPLLQEITPEYKEYAEAQRLINILKYFREIPRDYVPNNSLLKEFLGGGTFDLH